MADTKLTALSAFTPVRTDLLYGVDDPGGTPASGKMTIADALGLATAADVAIADAGSLIIATDAEAALQEIAANLDQAQTDIAAIEADYITNSTQDVYVFDASGNIGETRPAVSSPVVVWINTGGTGVKPTNALADDIWPTVPGEEIVTDATTTRTLTLDTDDGKTIYFTSGSAVTVTLPLNATQAFAVGTIITVMQGGTGLVTVDAAAGVTLNGTDGLNLALGGQRYGLALRKVATDIWVGSHLIPDLGGRQHLFIPAAAMISRTTSGAEAASTELATNDVMLETMNFDTAADEHVQFSLQMPKNWDEGTLVAQFIWSHPATTTNFGVTWAIQAVAFADGDAGDTAFGTAILVDDTGGTTDDVYISPESAAITVAGTPGAEEWVVFQVYRDVSDANDTMAVDARLHGVKIHWTNNALTAD